MNLNREKTECYARCCQKWYEIRYLLWLLREDDSKVDFYCLMHPEVYLGNEDDLV